jgi:hypothetical protein
VRCGVAERAESHGEQTQESAITSVSMWPASASSASEPVKTPPIASASM